MSDESELASKIQRATRLKAQCKKHQIFHEKAEEAEKMAEAGFLHAQVAQALRRDYAERVRHYEEAAICLARAKRLCRDIIRERTT